MVEHMSNMYETLSLIPGTSQFSLRCLVGLQTLLGLALMVLSPQILLSIKKDKTKASKQK